MRSVVVRIVMLLAASRCWSAPTSDAVIDIDLAKTNQGLALHHGLTIVTGRFGAALEFKNPLQVAEVPFVRKLDKAPAATVGGWLYPWRSGEQYFFARCLPASG